MLWLYFTKPAYMEAMNYMARDAMTMPRNYMKYYGYGIYAGKKSLWYSRVPKSSASLPLPPAQHSSLARSSWYLCHDDFVLSGQPAVCTLIHFHYIFTWVIVITVCAVGMGAWYGWWRRGQWMMREWVWRLREGCVIGSEWGWNNTFTILFPLILILQPHPQLPCQRN